jgi:hypothetical protein
VIQDVVRHEVAMVMQGMLTLTAPTTKKTRKRRKATNGRHKRRAPGRPPKEAS